MTRLARPAAALLLFFVAARSALACPEDHPAALVPQLDLAGLIAAPITNQPLLVQLATNPRVWVLRFPNLESQGQALNRVAALIERRGAPRDRILSAPEMDRLIRESGLTAATFYYGHDYRLTDLARFFALAAGHATLLTPAEEDLRCILLAAGVLSGSDATDPTAALISAAATPTTVLRPILRHEISHGEFFSNSLYRDYCFQFWADLSREDQSIFQEELGSLGYDSNNLELTINEMQAFLWEESAGAIIDLRLHHHHASLEALRRRFLAGIDDHITHLFDDDLIRTVYPYQAPGSLPPIKLHSH